MLTSVLATVLLLATALAAPRTNHVLHEKRDRLPRGWAKTGKLDSRFTIPVKIGLAQSNLDKFDNFLLEVSDPKSPSYGQHWNAKQVAETFAPSAASDEAVRQWLKDAGITEDRLTTSQSLGWLKFMATVEEAERLLQTEYHVYEHESGVPQVGCEKYHVPEHVSKHIDFVTPTIHFDADLKPGSSGSLMKKRFITLATETPDIAPAPGSQKFPTAIDAFKVLKNCSTIITPECLRILYGIPELDTNLQKRPLGVFEKSPQAFLQPDLDMFFKNFSAYQVHTSPHVLSIDGGYAQTFEQGFGYNGESNLDLEYAMTLVNPMPVTLYQVGDPYAGASFDTFLDALDKSFCTYEGGDNATEGDSVYPDTTHANGYTGPLACGGFALTKVISNSYGHNENAHSLKYNSRQCYEYGKLGLQGSSILYSSGDYGVAGSGGECTFSNGTYSDGSSGAFTPSFPSTCPYITSVGATQVKTGSTASVTVPEKACESVIYSGGGFSNQFAMPSYQSSAITSYLAAHKPPYGPARYNTSGTSRAYPDVAANGANYLVALDGAFELVFGTSASCPTFASVVTLINELRAQRNQSALGFLNPVLYANAQMFTDITKGGNQGCGTKGFQAVEGWDPVTGLGTPVFSEMVKALVG